MTAKQMIGQLRNLHPDTLLTIKIEDNHDFTPVGGIRDASATEMFAETPENPRPVAIAAICDTHTCKEHDAVAKALERLGYAPSQSKRD